MRGALSLSAARSLALLPVERNFSLETADALRLCLPFQTQRAL